MPGTYFQYNIMYNQTQETFPLTYNIIRKDHNNRGASLGNDSWDLYLKSFVQTKCPNKTRQSVIFGHKMSDVQPLFQAL